MIRDFIKSQLTVERINFWLVVLVVNFLPTYLLRFKIGSIPFTVLEVLILFSVLAFVIIQIANKSLKAALKNFLANKFTFPALLLLVAATTTIFVSPDWIAALGIWKAYFIEPLLFFFVFVSAIKTRAELKQVAAVLIASANFIALTAIVQYFTGWGIPESYNLEGTRRATSFYGYPAAVGLFIAPALTFTLGTFLAGDYYKKSRDKVLAGIMIVIMFLGLVFSQTEGAILGVLAALFVVGMLSKYRWQILAITLLLVMVVLAIPATRDYVVTLATFQDVSGDVRLVLWQGTTRLLADNPVFGAGLAGFPELYEKYKEARHVELSLYPHNIFLNFWSETGALGLIALLLVFFQYFKQGFKNLLSHRHQLTTLTLPLLAAMICVIVYGLVDVTYFKNDLSVMFWMWVGMMVVKSTK